MKCSEHYEVEAYFSRCYWSLKRARSRGEYLTGDELEHVGYVPGRPQSEPVQAWMVGMFSIFPACFYALSGLALLRFRFSRADLDEAQRAVGRATGLEEPTPPRPASG